MDIPADLHYTAEHEWVKVNGDIAIIGITDYAQGELGDIVFVELPEVGDETKQKDSFGTIEAVKAVSELYTPISGKIVEVNSQLEEQPELINSSPYSDGWLIKLKITNKSELDELLSADNYKAEIS